MSTPQGSPAHAGIDPGISLPARIAQGFPRTRGDRPVVDMLCPLIIGVPPHTRG